MLHYFTRLSVNRLHHNKLSPCVTDLQNKKLGVFLSVILKSFIAVCLSRRGHNAEELWNTFFWRSNSKFLNCILPLIKSSKANIFSVRKEKKEKPIHTITSNSLPSPLTPAWLYDPSLLTPHLCRYIWSQGDLLVFPSHPGLSLSFLLQVLVCSRPLRSH